MGGTIFKPATTTSGRAQLDTVQNSSSQHTKRGTWACGDGSSPLRARKNGPGGRNRALDPHRNPLFDYFRVDLNPGVVHFRQNEKLWGLSLSLGSQKVEACPQRPQIMRSGPLRDGIPSRLREAGMRLRSNLHGVRTKTGRTILGSEPVGEPQQSCCTNLLEVVAGW